jgi:hypothetical protein
MLTGHLSGAVSDRKGEMMAERPTYAYGEPNWETVGRWLHLGPSDDGPVWMLNLMKYRTVAAYADRRASTISGREADDSYAPLGPLSAVGATVALFGDVTAQRAGEPAWDRVALVRYPTRLSFFEMQERDDFKEKYVHKEAGMEFSIIMGCVPAASASTSTPVPAGAGRGDLVLRVRRFADGARPEVSEDGVEPVARFEVDGVVLGDERAWDEVRVDRIADTGAVSRLVQSPGVAEQVICVVEPGIDRLVESVVPAGQPADGGG